MYLVAITPYWNLGQGLRDERRTINWTSIYYVHSLKGLDTEKVPDMKGRLGGIYIGTIHKGRPHRGGRGVGPKADIVREVAWI